MLLPCPASPALVASFSTWRFSAHNPPPHPPADKEIERLAKQEGKLEKELAGLQARLSNKKFVDKAPPAVVAEVQGQAADLSEQLATVREKIEKFRALA